MNVDHNDLETFPSRDACEGSSPRSHAAEVHLPSSHDRAAAVGAHPILEKIRRATTLSLVLQLSVLLGCSNNSNAIDVDELVNSIGSPGADEFVAMETCIQSVPDALPIILACRDTIREAASTGENRKAHRPLELLGWLLNHLTFMLQEEGIDGPKKQAYLDAVVKLNLQFDDVHVKYDKDRKLVYQPVSDEIDATILQLEKLCSTD